MTKWSAHPTKQEIEDAYAQGDEERRQAFRRWLMRHDDDLERLVTVKTLRSIMAMLRSHPGIVGPEHEFRVRIGRQLARRVTAIVKDTPRGSKRP